MTACKFCSQDNLEWYQDSQEKWKLGIKLDINNYRPHRCTTQEKTPNKRNWVKFSCIRCGCLVKQNIKLIKSKTINLCSDCDNSC